MLCPGVHPSPHPEVRGLLLKLLVAPKRLLQSIVVVARYRRVRLPSSADAGNSAPSLSLTFATFAF